MNVNNPTNIREVLAFFLTQAVRIAVQFAVTVLIFAPLYVSLARSGRVAWMVLVPKGISTLLWFAAFPLFIALRALFGGVPEVVAGPGRERAFTSRGSEFGAYALAYVSQYLLSAGLGISGLAKFYSALHAGGHGGMVRLIGIALSLVIAVIFFVIFVGLRRDFAVSRRQLGGADVGFGGAVAAGLRKYALFYGRARRPEYWYWVLFEILLAFGLTLLDGTLFGPGNGGFPMFAIIALQMPALAVTVRRLHDGDYSGWWVLLLLIPLIGPIALLIMLCQPGTTGPNRFGPEYSRPRDTENPA